MRLGAFGLCVAVSPVMDALIGGWQLSGIAQDFRGANNYRPNVTCDLCNRTNFAAPNGNRSAAGFGTITAAYDPRQLQLGVKILW